MSEETKKQEEIVVNLDAFAVPMAIVVAGIIIAGAIYFTNRDNPKSDLPSNNNNVAGADDENDEFESATTTIDDDPYLGNKDTAKVAIVEFTDFQCPYCYRHVEQTYPEIIKNYVDTGKAIYVIRDFPLDFHGQISIDSAQAAECVYEIAGVEKYKEYHDKIFEVADKSVLTNTASTIGVDMNKFNTCMNDQSYVDEIKADLADGQKAGIGGTPGFVIGTLNSDGTVNGKLIGGAYPYSSFEQVINSFLD